MILLAVLDMSAFIWDTNHFEVNKPDYYKLMVALPNILSEIKKNKISLVLRGELMQEIQFYFPYSSYPYNYYDYRRLTLSYLTNINLVDFPNTIGEEINCSPNIIKDFFSDTTQTEIKYLLKYLYSESNDNSRFLTFSIFWDEGGNLILSNGYSKEIKTFQCDNIGNHKKIIDSIKKIFDHNPKHNKYSSSNFAYYGKVISPLSCFNERHGDKTEAQKLLDEAIYFKGDFFNYDNINNTYVMFVYTEANIYHGFNIKPSTEDIALINKELKNE
jgi:hypothetical protein